MPVRPFCGLLVLACLPALAHSQETKKFTPDQLETDQPKGIVTITFKVDKLGVAPFMDSTNKAPTPLALVSSGSMKDKEGQIWIAFTGKALDQLRRLGLDDGTHFRGKTIEATGSMTYRWVRYGSFLEGGTIKITDVETPSFYMIVENLDRFLVVR